MVVVVDDMSKCVCVTTSFGVDVILLLYSEALCRQPHQTPRDVPVELAEWEKRRSQTAPELSLESQQVDRPLGEGPELGDRRYEVARDCGANCVESMEEGEGRGGREDRNGTRRKKKRQFLTRRKEKNFIKSAEFDHVGRNEYPDNTSSDDDDMGGATGTESSTFRSLLLFIPLRLGQDKFNLQYKEALKV